MKVFVLITFLVQGGESYSDEWLFPNHTFNTAIECIQAVDHKYIIQPYTGKAQMHYYCEERVYW